MFQSNRFGTSNKQSYQHGKSFLTKKYCSPNFAIKIQTQMISSAKKSVDFNATQLN